MQIRFLHDPSKDIGFVGCALASTMVRFSKTQDGSWSHEVCKTLFMLVSEWLALNFVRCLL